MLVQLLRLLVVYITRLLRKERTFTTTVSSNFTTLFVALSDAGFLCLALAETLHLLMVNF